jgi:hypothetical protein
MNIVEALPRSNVASMQVDQRPRLFLKLVVLLNLSTTWQAPRSAAVKTTASTDSKLLANPVSLHPYRKARNQKCDRKAHDDARSVAVALVRVFWLVWEICEAMLGLAEHAWSTP